MNDEFWLAKVKIAKRNKQRVGLVQGSWDLFHLGHLRYILKARELCDFLVIAMDGDAKIRKRKGPTRPVIPESERHEFIELLGIADAIVVKGADEPKWHLIKTIRPDVLIAISENYSDDDIEKLKEFCGEVAILPRQAETSTSDKIRQITIDNRVAAQCDTDKVLQAIQENIERLPSVDVLGELYPSLFYEMAHSTDEVHPVCAACKYQGKWYFGTNQVDTTIPSQDKEQRTELFYSTVEHAEINLLKKMGYVEDLSSTPVYLSLCPCDRCLKTLINKGVKQVFYLEDRPEAGWSIRAHKLAQDKGVELRCLF